MSVRYFHGTLADLPVGTVLVPGRDIDLSYYGRSDHVYAVATDFDCTSLKWDDRADTPDNRLAVAVNTAAEWAGWAADLTCKNTRHGYDPIDCECNSDNDDDCECPHPINDFHVESVREGMWPACLRVYEVEPLGPIEPDTSPDVTPHGIRTTEARVLRRITQVEQGKFVA